MRWWQKIYSCRWPNQLRVWSLQNKQLELCNAATGKRVGRAADGLENREKCSGTSNSYTTIMVYELLHHALRIWKLYTSEQNKKQANNRLFLQIKSGRILNILWAFFITTTTRRELAIIISYPTRTRGIIIKYTAISRKVVGKSTRDNAERDRG